MAFSIPQVFNYINPALRLVEVGKLSEPQPETYETGQVGHVFHTLGFYLSNFKSRYFCTNCSGTEESFCFHGLHAYLTRKKKPRRW